MPTLRLIGEIEGLADAAVVMDVDRLFPLFMADLRNRLNLNSYEIQCIISKLKIKGNSKYHTEISLGKNSQAHKYSESLIPVIERMLLRPNFLKVCKEEYGMKQKEKIKATRSSKRK